MCPSASNSPSVLLTGFLSQSCIDVVVFIINQRKTKNISITCFNRLNCVIIYGAMVIKAEKQVQKMVHLRLRTHLRHSVNRGSYMQVATGLNDLWK